MSKQSQALGKQGEQIAQLYLQQKGFQITAYNWRPHGLALKQTAGEVDIIAYHPEQNILAFVEVKTRRSSRYGFPAEAVDLRKQARLALLAQHFLEQSPTKENTNIRFDVISILQCNPQSAPQLEHYENAFHIES